jgi:outer membrane protein assembly factor BamA
VETSFQARAATKNACAIALGSLLVISSLGCASAIPKNRYGIDSVEIRGADKLDDQALLTCIATRERERFGFTLGPGELPECGVPPFDASRTPVNLWTWPWTEWPLLNESAFERDLDRVERWYAARGYYDARVTQTRIEKDTDDRTAEVRITVDEGLPALVVGIALEGEEALDEALQEELRDALALSPGEPFDEAVHDQTKASLERVLFDASYANATVAGRAYVDIDKKLVRVTYTLVPGPACTFGAIAIEGEDDLPAYKIYDAASIRRGQPFSLTALDDARRAIYALGPFASVDIERKQRADSSVVDLVVRVVPGRRFRFGIGVGIEAGGLYSQEGDEGTGDSFAQWDAHLLGRIEHRNFLGGMRRLRIEDRPRLIFDDPFPGIDRASIGNLLTAEIRHPAFTESRTTMVTRVRWDRGPDPYGGRFFRHDLVAGIGPERDFFGGKLRVSSSINADLFLPDQQNPYPNTQVAYFYHLARVDLRDDPRNPRRGAYFSFGVQHAGYFLPSDWDYVRLTQDSRGYIPLPYGLVLAGRARIGFMTITDTAISVPDAPPADDVSPNAERLRTEQTFLENLATLGPLRHRLRGGGHNSVRGYAPNTLGDVERINGRLVSGGLRQWEASLELRVPITESFGAAAFMDMGDVARGPAYRFDHPQTSFGIGLRYRTIVGPLRFDAAIAPPDLQVFGQDDRIRTGVTPSRMFDLANGAVHFTIGEAF